MRSPHGLKHPGLKWLTPLLALALSACGDKPPQQPAAAAPPVTVAQPVKRTVTDWDEFTGRFEAVEEVRSAPASAASSPASNSATAPSSTPAICFT